MPGKADDMAVLRERVRVLAAGHGLAQDFAISDDVRRHAEAGRTVQAIRLLRRQTPGRLSLLAAKRMVDALHASARPRD